MIFWNIETNLIAQREDISKSLQKKVPEWALYFEWIVSDGNENRNWYTIESNAWFFEKNKYVKDFLKTWSILYNHDSDKPIWRPLSFELWEDWKINVSWYVYDDNYTNWAITRGLILWLSTGHITHERVWEDKTWKRISNEEFFALNWDQFKEWRPWNMIVTKAEIVEFSFVTTRSNRASVLTNEVDNIAQKLNKSTNEVETLFLNYKNPMEKEDIEKNGNPNEATPEVTEGTPAGTPTEENGVNVESLKNELEAEKNKLSELQTNFDNYKNEAETKINALTQEKETLQKEVNDLKEKARDEVLKNAPKITKEENKNGIKTLDDFKKKHSNK